MATGKLTSSLTSTLVYDTNSTWNDSFEDFEVTANPMEGFPYPSLYSWRHIISACLVVTLIMLVIVLGNVLVVLAIATDRRLKGVQHWFIGSLAVSDLLVGLFIMPFSLANEVMGYWAFGDVICQLWLSTDVLLCTASILNLCLISLDRYWTITRPIHYVKSRTGRRAALMISVVWSLSMVISLPPLVGWKRPQPTHLGFPLCQLSNELGYVVYSTIGSFYVPLLVMVLVYVKIYLAARARARRNLKSTAAVCCCCCCCRCRRCCIRKQLKSTGNAASSRATAAVTVAAASSEVDDRQLPVVHVEVDSSCELECDDNLTNSQSAVVQGDRKHDEMEFSEVWAAEEQQQCTGLLSARTASNDDHSLKPAEDPADNRSTSSVSRHQLAVEYHPAVDDGYTSSERRRTCLRSRADDVITLDSCAADRLLPQSPRSVNAKRRAEFFGLKLPSPDHAERTMSHLGDATSSSSSAAPVVSSQPLLVCPALAQPRRSMIVDEQQRFKRKLARARERRATLVLGVVMASFIGCWLPFFSIYPLTLLFDLYIPDGLFAFIFWLGYCNSALNPFIYTIFNREFRAAFVSILCRHRVKRGGRRRPASAARRR